MIKISAKGKKNKKDMAVECTVKDGVAAYTFNGKQSAELEEDLRRWLEWTPIGGTYYPKTLALQIVAALDSRFFDRSPDVHVSGDELLETVPYKKGVIY